VLCRAVALVSVHSPNYSFERASAQLAPWTAAAVGSLTALTDVRAHEFESKGGSVLMNPEYT